MNTTTDSVMDRYRMYNCECEAILIDHAWYHFLTKERRMVDVIMGHYLVKCIDGREEIWDPVRFERLFYRVTV